MQISEGREHRPPTTLGVRVANLSQSMHVTDGRTDRITTPKTALAYARAVKTNPNTTKLALVKTQNMNLNSSSVRTAHTSVHMTVHSCVAQYSTEQF